VKFFGEKVNFEHTFLPRKQAPKSVKIPIFFGSHLVIFFQLMGPKVNIFWRKSEFCPEIELKIRRRPCFGEHTFSPR